jgi:hypothetical protein
LEIRIIKNLNQNISIIVDNSFESLNNSLKLMTDFCENPEKKSIFAVINELTTLQRKIEMIKNIDDIEKNNPEINFYDGYARITGKLKNLYGKKYIKRFESILNEINFINGKEVGWEIGFQIDPEWNPDDPAIRLVGILNRIKKEINSKFKKNIFDYDKPYGGNKWIITISNDIISNALGTKTLFNEIEKLIKTDKKSAKQKIKQSIKEYPSSKNEIHDLALQMNAENNFINVEFEDMLRLQKISEKRLEGYNKGLEKLIKFGANPEVIKIFKLKVEFFKRYLPIINEWIRGEENKKENINIEKKKDLKKIKEVINYITQIKFMQEHNIVRNEIDRIIYEYRSLNLIKNIKPKVVEMIEESDYENLEIEHFDKLLLKCGAIVVETAEKEGFPSSNALENYFAKTIFYDIIDIKNEEKPKTPRVKIEYILTPKGKIDDNRYEDTEKDLEIIKKYSNNLNSREEIEKQKSLDSYLGIINILFEKLYKYLHIAEEQVEIQQQILDEIQEIFFGLAKRYGNKKLLIKINEHDDPKVRQFCKKAIRNI